MSDIYFFRVAGGSCKELAESLVDAAEESNLSAEDNIVVVPEEIEPLDRGESVEYLEQMAGALDMEVHDGGQ